MLYYLLFELLTPESILLVSQHLLIDLFDILHLECFIRKPAVEKIEKAHFIVAGCVARV